MDVVIVGAGTFGASLAWWLARAGERVTLVDQFEPGDRRASSGGETRLMRCSHGDDADYTRLARHAHGLWRELEDESGAALLVECGVVWFAHREDGWEAQSQRTLKAEGIPVQRLDPTAAAALYPSFGGDDLAFALLEPEAGVLRAQRAVRALVERAVAHGAHLVRARARSDGGEVVLEDSTRLDGDVVVWACGGWLARLFGELVSLRTTRQEVLFLDSGPGWDRAPGWVDYDRAMYGTGDVDSLGFKAAYDAEGPPLDPDEALVDTATTEPQIRAYMGDRFPALEHARLVDARSCRYELTPDSRFIAAPHPAHPHVWLVGGGSGHGFKHGPAMAERLAGAIAGETPLPPWFGLGQRRRSRSLRTAGSGVGSAV
jgi:glycine/D-amino acid oxidase-like deaminating enzyme